MALMKKLTSAIVASSLVLGLVGTVGATTPDKVQTAADRMLKLHLINGVTPGTTDLALSAYLTRAQLVTILVRAFGQEGNAKYLNGAAAFPDTASHPWASGYIAMAKRIIADRTGGKEVVGMPNGTFNPDGNVTAAEAVAFLMKFVGAPKDDSLAWPDNYIEGAAKAGLITAEDKGVLMGEKNAPATRGLAFYLADRTFYGYKLVEGGTTYTTFVDNVKPTVTVDAVPATTLEDKVIVTGTVTDDTVAVHVGTMDNSATIANGKFTATVNLKVGDNSILVHALDLAGNPFEQTIKVTRTVGNAASIEAAEITVAAGGIADVKAVVKDAKGNEITGATVTAESTVGTFADGKFTAGTKAGEGKLTLKVGELTKDVKVTIVAADLAKVVATPANAKVGERVQLSAQDQYGNAVSGVTYSINDSDALLDGSQGVFVASKAKNYTVTATKGDKTATGTIGVYSTTVGQLKIVAPEKVVGNTDPGTYAGSDYEIKVQAVDTNGNLVANYTGEIAFTVPSGFVPGTDETATNTVITKKAVAGVATFKVQANAAAVGQQVDFGTVQTTLADGTTVIGDDSSEVVKASVQIVEQLATSVKFSTTNTAAFIRANEGTDSATSASVYLADQNGKRFLGASGYVVNLSVSGAAKINGGKTTDSVVYTGSPIVVNIDSIRGVTGEAVVTATVEGLGTATVKTVAAIAGNAAAVTVKADVAQAVANRKDVVTYTVQVVDKNGVPVNNQSTPLTATINTEAADRFTVNDGVTPATPVTAGSAGSGKSTFTVTTDGATGTATFTIDAKRYVGDLTLSIQDTAAALTAASTNVKFVADAPAYVVLNRIDAIKVSAASPKATLEAQVYDAAGNKAAVAGLNIKFTSTDDVKFNGTAKVLEVATDATGKASVDATVLGYVGAQDTVTITGTKADGSALAVVDYLNVTKDTVTIAVENAVATTLTTSVKVAGNNVFSVAAGTTVDFTVYAKDSFGKYVSGETIYVIPAGKAFTTASTPAEIDTTAGIKMTESTDANGNPVYIVSLTPATSGSFQFTIKDTTPGTALASNASLRVNPTVAKSLAINGGKDLTVKQNVASPAISLKLADQYSNPVTAPSNTKIEIKAVKATTTTVVNPGIRTSVSSADVETLTLNAGLNTTSFYVLNSLPTGNYTVTFQVYTVDALGNRVYTGANSTPLPSGTMNLIVQAQ